MRNQRRNTLRLIVALSAFLALTGVAHAGTMYSPPLVPANDESLDCALFNTGRRDATVRVQIFGDRGDLEHDSGDIVVAPETELLFRRTSVEDALRVCKFTVNRPLKNFRASASIARSDGHTRVSVPAN